MAKDNDLLYDDQLNEDEQGYEQEYAEEYDDENGYDEYEDAAPDAAPENASEDEQDDSEYEDQYAPYEGEEDDKIDEADYFDKLLKYLEKELETGTSVPLTTKRLVNIERCMDIIKSLRKATPDAITYCLEIINEKQRILSRAEQYAKDKAASTKVHSQSIITEAQDKAARIVDSASNKADAIVADAQERARAILADAEARAKKLISEEEIVRRAREEAQITVENSRNEARARRLQAVTDAYRLLDACEKHVRDISRELAQRRDELRGTDQ